MSTRKGISKNVNPQRPLGCTKEKKPKIIPLPSTVKDTKEKAGKSIGTRNESSLHRTLKFKYAGRDGKTEVTMGEYVADGVSKNGEYIEVQTGNFAPLQRKVKELAAAAKVRIIHPIAASKTIEVYAPSADNRYGTLLYRRKSPVKGSLWKIFDALLHAPQLPLIRRVTVEVVMVDITEKRIKDGKGAWRRRGISVKDKELSALHETILFKKAADYLCFIPFGKNEEFTTTLLAEHTGISKDTARKAMYVLAKMKVVKRIGKKKNSWVYVKK